MYLTTIVRFLAIVIVSAACLRDSGQTPEHSPVVQLAASDSTPALQQDTYTTAPACIGDTLAAFDYAGDSVYIAERERYSRSASVERDAGELRITLRNGVILRLPDCRVDNGDRYISFRYLGTGPGGRGFLVEEGYYESSVIAWINDSTGNRTSLAAPPAYSRDSAYFAIANADLEAQYTPNLFEIWAVRGSDIVRVLNLPLGDHYGAEDPRWTEPRTVIVDRVELDSTWRLAVNARLRAVEGLGQWQVDTLPP